jgi:two-component system probable response regulator PhcQ
MSHKVLIVDDEPEVIDIMQHFLQIEHYEVRAANSAEDALKILRSEPIDVIVSDEWMTGMSGTKFLGVVRRDYPDTIRILLTGHADLDTAIRAINDGEIYRFFTKPCNFGELTGTLRQAIQQKDLLAESRRLYSAYKHQTAYIKKMENKFPGMSKLDKTETGSIIIDDSAGNFDALLGSFKAEEGSKGGENKNEPKK